MDSPTYTVIYAQVANGEPIIGHDTFWSLVQRHDATQV